MNVTSETNLSIQNFNSFDNTYRRTIYQEANEKHDINLVRQLNELGMRPNVPGFSGPTIISNFMDIATKHDIILQFLTKLRKSGKLLTEIEFQPLSSKKWVEKSFLSRILGCDHLMEKIRENNLKHIKIPLKIAVVEETESLKVSGWDYSDNLYNIHSDQIKIYAENITSVDRKLSREEIDELIQVIATSNFVDLLPQNIVVAEDGIYFIDTEFKSFSGSISWEKLGRFESLINEVDKIYFREKVQKKIDEPKTIKHDLGYDRLSFILKMLRGLPESEETNNSQKDFEGKILDLEYVGAKEAGTCWQRPNRFSFNLSEIII